MPSSPELQHLRELLIAPETFALQDLEHKLEFLRQRITDPAQLADLLQPVIADVIRKGDPGLKLAILRAITPLLDRAVRDKTAEDPVSISDALAPTSTSAIAKHYTDAPENAANDLAPLMSAAIKSEIAVERDAMVDALYPVIGSTISKYVSETLTAFVQRINDRIESRIGPGSLGRKVRSWFTGVSEAELIVRDSLPLKVTAAFLIAKPSGLVISQFQDPDSPSLDSDLLSGMLTAIRSLFNDSMNGEGSVRELDQIEYGDAKIVLEVAGHCYLAAIVRGIPNETFRRRLRRAMTSIVQRHGDWLASFDGDATSVPSEIQLSVRELVRWSESQEPVRSRRPPYAVAVLAGVIVLAAAIPFGIYLYRNSIDRQAEAQISNAIAAAKPSPVRGIQASVDRGTIRLIGTSPNEYLRKRVADIALAALPGGSMINEIVADAEPPFPQLVRTESDEMVKTLNSIDGMALESSWQQGTLLVQGAVADSTLREKVASLFGTLPGLKNLDMNIGVGSFELEPRFLFKLNSVQIRSADRPLILRVRDFLASSPHSSALISGHCDILGGEEVNREIANGRAASIADALERLGIARDRLHVEGNPAPPPGRGPAQEDSLSRCVRVMLIVQHHEDAR